MKRGISAFDVERLATNTATDAERAEILARAADPDVAAKLAADLAEREAEHKAFAVDARRRGFASLAEQAGTKPARPWSWLMAGLGATAAACTLLFVIARNVDEGSGSETDTSSGVLVRGGLTLKVALLRDGVARELASGEALHASDRLRLTVDDPHGGYCTVLLEDARGTVTTLYAPTELGRLTSGRHILPESVELDAADGRERLWVLLSKEQPDVDAWRAEIARRAAAAASFEHGWLPAGETRVAVFEWTKAAPE